MNRKMLALLLVLLLCMAFSTSAFAYGGIERLVDEAGLLTETEYSALLDQLNAVSETLQYDVVVLTINRLAGLTPEQYAQRFYYETGYRPDGTILMLSMEERDYCISAFGEGADAFPDPVLSFLENAIISDLSAGCYAEAFGTYAALCEEIVEESRIQLPDTARRTSGRLASPILILVSLGVGLLAAFIGTAVMKGKLKSVHAKAEAGSYVRAGSLNITTERDVFLYRNVSCTPRNTESNHRSSGGRSNVSSHSGKF